MAYQFLVYMLYFIVFYTDNYKQIFVTLASTAIQTFVIMGYIYEEEVTVVWVTMKMILLLLFLAFLMLFALSMAYISQFQTRLKTMNSSNVRMLDGMHEGVLILSKEHQSTMFCNRSAK